MRFDLTPDQSTVVATLRGFLGDQLSDARRRSRIDGRTVDIELWERLCGLGFAGIGLDPTDDDAGLLELGLVAEELGAALAPVPFLPNAGAALLVVHAGSSGQRDRLLPGLLDGDAPGMFAVAPDGLVIDSGTESGPLVVVDDGQAYLAGERARRKQFETIDLLRRYSRLESADVGEKLPGDPATAIDMIEVLISAELTGVAQRALDLAVAYAREREQFGRKIGTFQGVSHRCAEMLLEVETARSTWWYAAWTARAAPEELPLAASTAKVAAVSAALSATTGALQVHGGIGFTWEHEIHLLLRRARTMSQILGDARGHRARIARLIGSATPPELDAPQEAGV
ncbi:MULTISPECIES: acyl-CoA dehydrogenase family protein [unclassified Nocardioides]|uniref:acyl-CoA dehydrogenase family protein n=1 Tax=unclassified Nocardioides TaxID=2615069 RepID=UPI000056F46F|nr:MULTISPECIES: acyl-CoA dehydrogenase family protein [unclassified Nocardioides]ABL80329.1 acyl-CoA dehydrogenase domain protein [Nocardioides sp. JS614]